MDPYASQPGAYIAYMDLPQDFGGGNLQPDLYMRSHGAHCIRASVEFMGSVTAVTFLFTLLTFTIVHLCATGAWPQTANDMVSDAGTSIRLACQTPRHSLLLGLIHSKLTPNLI